MAKKLPKRMFKNQDMVSPYQLNRSPMKLMKQISRDHEDVLQNIEATLVSIHRRDASVDDRIVDLALTASLSKQPPDDPQAVMIYASLARVREMRSDVPDNIWNDALKVVRDSVHRHSSRRPHDTSYLMFAAQYIV